MHGVLRIGVTTAALKIESRWQGLTNPELDPGQVPDGEEGISRLASSRMKEKKGEEAWAVVRVEGRDWGRVLGVGRLGGRVIACGLRLICSERKNSLTLVFFLALGFCHDHALILYVYLPNDDTGADESVLTVRQSVFFLSRLLPLVDVPTLF